MDIDYGAAEIRSFVCRKLKEDQWHMLPAVEKEHHKKEQYRKERMWVRKLYPYFVLFETENGIRYCFLYQDLYGILFPSGTKDRLASA